MPLTIPVNGVDQYGVILDMPGHLLPFNAWTLARNIRFRNGAAEKFFGDSPVMGTPTFSPYWAMAVGSPTTYWWVYAGLAKIGATDGVNHYDISRASGGDYSARLDDSWTGVVLGGVPIVNNGVDAPQYWPALNGTTRMAPLPNWPANTTCRSLRAYLNFLIAMDVTEGGDRYPHLIRWSQPAEPGAVPSTWDYSDTTSDSGRRMIGDSDDFLLDGVALARTFVLYKEGSIWAMQYTGGQEIFDTRPITAAEGMIAKRCAVEYSKGKHAVFGQNDFLIHDGQTIMSIANERIRKNVFSTIDSVNYRRSFILYNRSDKEVWFAYPENGSDRPNKVAAWNFERDRWGFRDLPRGFYATPGVIEQAATSDTWESDTGAWDSDTTKWDERLYNPLIKKPLIIDPLAPAFLLAENTAQFSGSSMVAILEREAIPLPISGKVDAPPDFTTWKQFLNIWPHIEGAVGTSLEIQVGTKEDINSDTVWQDPKTFIIGRDEKVDCFGAAGRLLSIRFRSTINLSWALLSYEVELIPRGKF